MISYRILIYIFHSWKFFVVVSNSSGCSMFKNFCLGTSYYPIFIRTHVIQNLLETKISIYKKEKEEKAANLIIVLNCVD